MNSPSKFLNEQLKTVREISSTQESSIISTMDLLHEKVFENAQLKEENETLKNNLKVLKETLKLQEAAFAFQKEEYEKEIEKLKNEEKLIRDKLMEIQQNQSRIQPDVQVDVTFRESQEKIKKLTEECENWKKKYKKLKEEKPKKEQNLVYDVQNTQTSSIILNETENSKEILSPEANQNENETTQKDENNELLNESIKLQKEMSKKEQENKVLKKKIKKLKKEISSLHDKEETYESSQQEIEDMQKQVKSLNKEKKNLTNFLRKAQSKITKLKTRYETAESELQKTKETLSQTTNSAATTANNTIMSSPDSSDSDVENQNQRDNNEKEKIENLNSQISVLNEEKSALLTHNNLLMQNIHYIFDLFDINEQDMDALKKKAKYLLSLERICNDLKEQNSLLSAKLRELIQELKQEKDEKKKDMEVASLKKERDNLAKSLRKSVNENEVLKASQHKEKLVSYFSFILCHQSNKFYNSLMDLHSAIFTSSLSSKQKSLRVILLSIIFMKRFFKLPKLSGETDLQGIFVYASHSGCSLDQKMSDLRQKFTDITRELLLTKQTAVEYGEKLKKTTKELEKAKTELEKTSYGTKEMKEKIEFYENRNKSLQKELGTLISQEDFQDMIAKYSNFEKNNIQLKARIAELNAICDEKSTQAQISMDKAEKLSVALHDRTALMDEYTAQIEEKEKNIKYLNMLLHEKTKEILSLERIVNRYHENEQILKSSYNRLAVENLNLKLGNDENAPPPNTTDVGNEGIQIPTATINPIFLGNT